MLNQILNEIVTSPFFGIIGVIAVIGIILYPAILSVAGLTGQQIIDLHVIIINAAINLIREFRNEPPR